MKLFWLMGSNYLREPLHATFSRYLVIFDKNLSRKAQFFCAQNA